MTTTVESFLGSGRMVDGFFLNKMTDFSCVPKGPNAIAPGKRPRSSMTPTIILNRDGNLAGAIGSPGGNAILAYVSKALIGTIDWNLPLDQAFALPNLLFAPNKRPLSIVCASKLPVCNRPSVARTLPPQIREHGVPESNLLLVPATARPANLPRDA